jgi:hypothetical protein
MTRALRFAAAFACLLAAPAQAEPVCEGQLEVRIGGAFTARVGPPARQSCEGGPRPDDDGLRVAYRSVVIENGDSLLVILGLQDLERGQTGARLPLNVTVVREGKGEFFGTRGPDLCTADLTVHEPAGDPDLWRLAGEGRCHGALQAVAREGEITLAPFRFSAVVSREVADEEVLRVRP